MRTCRARARCKLDPTVISGWSSTVAVTIEPHSPPWIVERDLPELAGSYPGSRLVEFPYDGPRARISRLKVDHSGRGAGTPCSFDTGEPDFSLALILWFDVGFTDETIWAPLGLFLTAARDFTVVDYWGVAGRDWPDPMIVERGDTLWVRMRAGLESPPGCRPGNQAFCDVNDAQLSLELECASH